MDHLPRLKDPVSLFPDVPYYGEQELQHATAAETRREWLKKRVAIKFASHFSTYSFSEEPLNKWLTSRAKQYRPLQSYRDKLWGWSLEQDSHGFSAFTQEWLFFGVLEEFFHACELPFDRADFFAIRQDGTYLTTAALNDYLLALVVQEELRRQDGAHEDRGLRLHDNDGMHRNEDRQRWQNSNKAARWRLVACHEVIKAARDVLLTDIKPRVDLLDPAVWDAIILLVATLSRAVDSIFRSVAYNSEEFYYPIDFREFRFRSIHDIRKDKSWCPRERVLIENLVEGRLPEMAFFSQLQPDPNSGIHAGCTDDDCVAYQVADDYQTKHVNSACSCMTVTFVPSEQQSSEPDHDIKIMARRMASSSIGQSLGADRRYEGLTKEITAIVVEDESIKPVVVPIGMAQQAEKLNKLNKFSIAKKIEKLGTITTGRKLVAISHVWSDGLGNPTANALPLCQLNKIQQAVNQLYPESEHPIPFWIDTLMIPIIPIDASEAMKERKRNSLREMEWVYKKATRVLVLDAGLQILKTAELTVEEKGAHIMCSTWSRRLWTLQEGCVADHTYFQFADKVVSQEDLHGEVLDATSLKGFGQNASVLHEDHPIRKKQELPWIHIHRRGFIRSFDTDLLKRVRGDFVKEAPMMFACAAIGSVAGPAGAVVGGLAGSAFDVTSPKFQSMKRLGKRLFKVINPVWYSIYRFLQELSIGWNSSLTGGVSGGPLARCMRAMYHRNCTKSADESLVLASLLSSTPGIPATLTKVEDEQRMQVLLQKLSQVPIEILFVDQQRYEDRGCRWMPKSLLGVNAPGSRPIRRPEKIRTRNLTIKRKDNLICTATAEGLEFCLDGLRMHPQPCSVKVPFRFSFKDAFFSVELKRPGTTTFITELPEATWVMIPELSFISFPWQCQAILVKVVRSFPARPGGQTELCALATIKKLTSEEFEESKYPIADFRLHEKQRIFTRAWTTDFVGVVSKLSIEQIKSDDKWIVG